MSARDKIVKIVTENVKKLVSENLPGLIHEAINECIYEEIDDEISRYNEERMTATLENISKTHGISLNLLLRDMPKNEKRGGLCRGVKEGNLRCSFKATCDGYCKFHKGQGDRIKKRELPSTNLHTHGADKMFVKGCPGCESSNSKELIDLNSILFNE